MKNGLKRYYKIFNRAPGPNYYVFDRKTGKKIHEGNDHEKTTNFVNDKNIEDAKERGIDLTDPVETPSNYFGTRNGTPQEIAPMIHHGSKDEAEVN